MNRGSFNRKKDHSADLLVYLGELLEHHDRLTVIIREYHDSLLNILRKVEQLLEEEDSPPAGEEVGFRRIDIGRYLIEQIESASRDYPNGRPSVDKERDGGALA